MNLKLASFFFLSLFAFKADVKGQIDFNFMEVKAYLDLYRFDSAIGYSYYENYDNFDLTHLNNIGQVDITGVVFLIGIKGDSMTTLVFVMCDKGLKRSNPISLGRQSLVDTLFENVTSISEESIFPYTYSIKEKDTSFSIVARGMHETSFDIIFASKDSIISKNFFETDFERFYRGSDLFPPNSYFEYNTSLKSYKIYQRLLKLFSGWGERFQFN